jgi:hypothetical protein
MTQQLQIITSESQKEMILAASFSTDMKKYMVLAISKLFKDLTDDEKINLVTQEFEKALTRTGTYKPDATEKGFTIADILEMINEKKYITQDEVSEIFKKGSLGLLGEYFGINVKSVSNWIEIFYKDVQRREALKKLNELQDAQNKITEMTPADKQTFIEKAIKDVFHDRKVNGYSGLEGISYPMYDFLWRRKILSPSEKEREYLKEEATEYLKSQMLSSHSTLATKEILDKFEAGEVDVTKLAKSLAVRDYFNSLISDGKEIVL